MNTENKNIGDISGEERVDEREVLADTSPEQMDDNTADTPDGRAEAPKPTRRRRKKATTDADSENADEAEKKPRKRRTKKADADVDEPPVAEDNEAKPKKPRKKRAKPTEGEGASGDVTEAEETTKKPRSKRRKKADAEVVEPSEAIAADEAEEVEREPLPETSDSSVDNDIPEDVAVGEDIPDSSDNDGFDIPAEPIFEAPEVDILGDPIEEDEASLEASEGGEEEIIEEPIVYAPRPLTKKEPRYDEEKPRRVDFLFDFVELFIFTLVAVLVITTFFIRHSVVEGTSMENTLHEGDVLIISDLFYTPSRGDVIVVQDTSTILKKPIVKRVIGLGGDVVRVAREGIYVNGELLTEEYVYTDNLKYTYHTLPADEIFSYEGFSIKFEEVDGKQLLMYYEFVVPTGELFVMGDHRNVSTDSRAIGAVKEDAIIGRVLFRLFPFDVFGAID